MSNLTYLRLVRTAHQMHLFWLLTIHRVSQPSGCADELLKACIESASYLIDNLQEDIEIIQSGKSQ